MCPLVSQLSTCLFLFLAIVCKLDAIHKTGVMYRSALKAGLSHGLGSMHRKFGENGYGVCEIDVHAHHESAALLDTEQ